MLLKIVIVLAKTFFTEVPSDDKLWRPGPRNVSITQELPNAQVRSKPKEAFIQGITENTWVGAQCGINENYY